MTASAVHRPSQLLLLTTLTVLITPHADAQRGAAAGAPVNAQTVASTLPKGPRAMMLADWYRVANVSTPSISPDGKRVAMTVTRAVEAENRRHSEIWVVNTAGGEPQRWTSPSTESANPRWSHDGKYLFFTSQRPGGRGNTWAIRLDEPSGEAVQVDGYPDGSMPSSHAFAVFTGPARQDPPARAAADPFARMQPMAKPPFDGITRPAEPARFDGRHIVDMTYKSNGVGFVPGRATARTWRPQQLWKQSVGDTARTMLTNTLYSHRSPTVSPDGQWIAFIAESKLRPDSVVDLERDSLAKLPYNKVRDEAERNDADIYVVPSAGGTT
jgi:Tol biopolymer transport system component